MVSHRRSVSLGTSFTGRRATARRATRLLGRHLVDPADRRTLERFTKIVPVASDLLAKITRVDHVGHLPARVATRTLATRTQRPDQLRGSFGRWLVFPSKKGGLAVGKTKSGKGTKIMTLVEAHGVPLAANIYSASPNEVTLIEPLIDKYRGRRRLKRLIYDLAADSDPLRDRLRRRGIDLICPHRSNRIKPKTQDGRKLRRYRRRWVVERTNSWLQYFRRLVVRYEHRADIFQGLVHLACLLITLRKF
jgi:transposase